MNDTKVEKELARGTNVSIINLIDCLIEKANTSGASDIHIDPSLDKVRVRLRIDGVLQDTYSFPKNIHSEVISHIKKPPLGGFLIDKILPTLVDLPLPYLQHTPYNYSYV